MAAAPSPRARAADGVPLVAITFDDGPWPGSTSSVLDLAAREQIPLTFFLIGSQVSAHPQLVRRQVAEGHEVASHTWTHPQYRQTVDRSAWEVASTSEAIEAATGRAPSLLRPPGGRLDSGVAWAARQAGLTVVLWDVDPLDWVRGTSPSIISSRVLSRVRPGSIILLHDGGGDRSSTVAAFPHIVAGLKAKGYRMVTVSQLLGAPQQ